MNCRNGGNANEREVHCIALLEVERSGISIMVSNKVIVAACAIAMLALFATPSASARTFDSRTYFTFSGPVELPGVMLEEGRYLFRIVDTTGSRRIVRRRAAGTRLGSER